MNREWAHDVDQQLRELHERTADLPVRIKPGGSGGGTSGPAEGTYVPLVTATTPEGLPSPAQQYTLGYVTAGDYQGGWFGRIDGEWVGVNVWRAV